MATSNGGTGNKKKSGCRFEQHRYLVEHVFRTLPEAVGDRAAAGCQAVLSACWEAADVDGFFHMSAKRVSERLACTERGAQKRIKSLVDAGILRHESKGTGGFTAGGRGIANKYRICYLGYDRVPVKHRWMLGKKMGHSDIKLSEFFGDDLNKLA